MEERDVGKLIELVKNKKILWDLCHPSYKNVKKKAQEWKLINERVKKKWKGLRDTYSRSLNKKNVSKQGTDKPDTFWKFSGNMEFLKEQLKPRTTISNSTSSIENTGWEGESLYLPATPTDAVDFTFSPSAEMPDAQCSLRCSSSEPSTTSISSKVRKVSEGSLYDDFSIRQSRKQKTSNVEETLLCTMQTVQEYFTKSQGAASDSSAYSSSVEDELYCRSLLAKLSTFPIELRNEAKIGMMKYLSTLEEEYLKKEKDNNK